MEIKHAKSKTKDREPSVTDNSVINALINFKLFECSKNFLNKLDATCEQVCMSTQKDTELPKYQQASTENSREKHYTELCNTKTNFNDNNNTTLSNVKI